MDDYYELVKFSSPLATSVPESPRSLYRDAFYSHYEETVVKIPVNLLYARVRDEEDQAEKT
jgi:hypothetical protein